jgi:peptidoglycan/xylan/chitin deacetylase (PgdA/CDA1 family)
MKISKWINRNVVAPVLYYSGISDIILRSNRQKILVLNYHGVVHGNYLAINNKHLSVVEFEKHLKLIVKKFQPIKYSETDLPYFGHKPRVVITFDDGFQNNFTVALPLLKKYKIPAVFFISAIAASKGDPIIWPDFIESLCFLRTGKEIAFDDFTFNYHGRLKFIDTKHNQNIFSFFKQLGKDQRTRIIDFLNSKYGVEDFIRKKPREFWALMNKEEISALVNAHEDFFSVGSHGYDHYNLANIPLSEMEYELDFSKKILEEVTNKDVDSIAFPDGNYNLKVAESCLKSGYKFLFGVNENQLKEQGINVISRFSVSSTTNHYVNFLSMVKATKG